MPYEKELRQLKKDWGHDGFLQFVIKYEGRLSEYQFDLAAAAWEKLWKE